MHKVLISGSWRYEDKLIEALVRKTVGEILQNGDQIVVGGALGVDSWVLDEVLKHDRLARSVQVFLPSTLDVYAKHYRNRANERVISATQAENLIAQLTKLKQINPLALLETAGVEILNQETYYARNSKEVEVADKLIAFQINLSQGTQDTIDKARRKKIPVQVHQFKL